jgi:two-component system, NarL family, response regulator NreC
MDPPHSGPYRVAIAGDQPVVRGAVRLGCESEAGLVVIDESPLPSDVVEHCRRLGPDVLVLDVDGAEDAPGALRALRDHDPSIGVVVLSERTDGSSVLEVMRSGVAGYLSKADGLHRVGPAILRVCHGERYVDPSLERAAVDALGAFASRARKRSVVEASLTPRELEILAMISEGLTMHQVGTRLGISPRTVETHVAKLYRKLGVRTRVHAVARASELGLLDRR